MAGNDSIRVNLCACQWYMASQSVAQPAEYFREGLRVEHSSSLQGKMERLAAARQLSDHPIVISVWRKPCLASF
jgi:hypothetical protein